MLALAIAYVIMAYDADTGDIDGIELATIVCEEHYQAQIPGQYTYPLGYPLVGEACDYINNPYLEEN